MKPDYFTVRLFAALILFISFGAYPAFCVWGFRHPYSINLTLNPHTTKCRLAIHSPLLRPTRAVRMC
jgi:hypothetical protein